MGTGVRGPDLLEYPWCNVFDGDNVVYWNTKCDYGTCDVGSRPGGVSWVGAYDIAGNVWEWMENNYDTSTEKVLRGGSWFYVDYNLRSAIRNWNDPTNTSNSIGFRCSRSY